MNKKYELHSLFGSYNYKDIFKRRIFMSLIMAFCLMIITMTIMLKGSSLEKMDIKHAQQRATELQQSLHLRVQNNSDYMRQINAEIFEKETLTVEPDLLLHYSYEDKDRDRSKTANFVMVKQVLWGYEPVGFQSLLVIDSNNYGREYVIFKVPGILKFKGYWGLIYNHEYAEGIEGLDQLSENLKQYDKGLEVAIDMLSSYIEKPIQASNIQELVPYMDLNSNPSFPLAPNAKSAKDTALPTQQEIDELKELMVQLQTKNYDNSYLISSILVYLVCIFISWLILDQFRLNIIKKNTEQLKKVALDQFLLFTDIVEENDDSYNHFDFCEYDTGKVKADSICELASYQLHLRCQLQLLHDKIKKNKDLEEMIDQEILSLIQKDQDTRDHHAMIYELHEENDEIRNVDIPQKEIEIEQQALEARDVVIELNPIVEEFYRITFFKFTDTKDQSLKLEGEITYLLDFIENYENSRFMFFVNQLAGLKKVEQPA